MYSFTSTNIHSLHKVQPNEPKLVIKCKCQRRLYQQEIYTCLICTSYSCHFCTQVEFVQSQCRSCRKQYDGSNRINRCQFCFACVQCGNVLTLSKDPNNKNYILMCQFCWWSTKDIKLSQEKLQTLLEKLNKYSSVLKDSEMKVYSQSYNFFKEKNSAIEMESKMSKLRGISRKAYSMIGNQEASEREISEKNQKGTENIVKYTSLEEPSDDFQVEVRYPQGLPLIAKKIRKCPQCKKPLTTQYRTRADEKNKLGEKSRHGEQKIELMYKDIKIIQCQLAPLSSNRAKIKMLKDAVVDGVECKKDTVHEVEANKEFEVSVKIENRMRNSVSEASYIFIVDGEIAAK